MAVNGSLDAMSMRGESEAWGWIGTAELSESIGVTVRTVYRLVETQGLPAYTVGRVIRFHRPEVDAWLSERRFTLDSVGDRFYPDDDPEPGNSAD